MQSSKPSKWHNAFVQHVGFGGLGVCSSKDAIWRYQLKVVVDKSVRMILRLVILGFVSQFKSDVCQFRTN